MLLWHPFVGGCQRRGGDDMTLPRTVAVTGCVCWSPPFELGPEDGMVPIHPPVFCGLTFFYRATLFELHFCSLPLT
jgi:hypothetical protein